MRDTKASEYAILISFGLLVLCAYFLYRNNQLNHEGLMLQQKTLSELSLARAQLTELQSRPAIPSTMEEREQLSLSPAQSSALSAAVRDINLAAFPNGLYEITAPVTVGIGTSGLRTGKDYTIYHIKTDIESGGATHPLHAGIATSGYLTAPKIYVDYDSDGAVDLHAMYEIVTWLPFHQLFSRSVNPVVSQEIYASFLGHYKQAKFTELSNISDHGSYLVRGLWNVVSEKGREIAAWGTREKQDKESGTPQQDIGNF